MKKVIILDISKENYENGIRMLNSAIVLMDSHGFWNAESANKIFGEKGWLPEYEEMMSLDEFKKKVKKGEI
jgi:hypothetical protein